MSLLRGIERKQRRNPLLFFFSAENRTNRGGCHLSFLTPPQGRGKAVTEMVEKRGSLSLIWIKKQARKKKMKNLILLSTNHFSSLS